MTAETFNRRSGWRRFLAVWLRVGLTAIAFIIQLCVFVFVLWRGSEAAPWVGGAATVISVAVLGFILNSRMPTEYKLSWTIIILLTPLFGGAFYLLFGSRTGTMRQLSRYRAYQDKAYQWQENAPGAVHLDVSDKGIYSLTSGIENSCLLDIPPVEHGKHFRSSMMKGSSPSAIDSAIPSDQICSYGADSSSDIDADAIHELAFLSSMGPFVGYRSTRTSYYSLGDEAFNAIIEALESARHWIALEYFIISDGIMWRTIAQILKRKASEGVEIRLLYDDIGSVWELPLEELRSLTSLGIDVRPVNRFGPGFTLKYNNRDHRKILIVDGYIAFSGGINIADEYINRRERFGHWKDTVIRLEGCGAWGMATLFFTLWDNITDSHTEVEKYRPDASSMSKYADEPGLVLNFDDTPFDDYSLGWAAYRNAMMRAHHTVDITTPYLVPTQDMMTAIASLARSGVRVRIVTPSHPDKPYVHAVTRSNYRPLVEAGVLVYEYTPGFIHAKQMLIDSTQAIIGTINFDYRSFYLHQENAVWTYRSEAVEQMAQDFDDMIAQSHLITRDQVRSTPWWKRGIWIVLRTFAPLF